MAGQKKDGQEFAEKETHLMLEENDVTDEDNKKANKSTLSARGSRDCLGS